MDGLNPLQVQTKPQFCLTLTPIFVKVSIPYRYKQNRRQCYVFYSSNFLSQSPIGTNKTSCCVFCLFDCCPSQSPIGTNKTENFKGGSFMEITCLNPLQVQTKHDREGFIGEVKLPSQSPIGTNKTCQLYKKLCFLSQSLNPLQVQTKLRLHT